jgi:hypothetical protein
MRDDLEAYTFEWFDVEASSKRRPRPEVGIKAPDGQERSGSFTGDGPVDGHLPRDQRRRGVEAKLRGVRVDAVTGGQDASSAEVSVVVEVGAVRPRARAVSTDIIEAAGRAYVRALSNARRRGQGRGARARGDAVAGCRRAKGSCDSRAMANGPADARSGAPPGLEAATLCAAFQRSASEMADEGRLRTLGDAMSITWRE